jgi:4-amino-4-deoxy-L-arabinose transferase-like glycosyltransferase
MMTKIRIPIWLPLTAILLASLVLRLAAGWYWQSQRPADRPFVFGDSESYWELGRSVAHGEPYQFGTPDAKVFRTPGYPAVLSLVFLLGGEQPSPLAARFISALCGTIAVAAVYGLARSLFDRSAGLIAAAMIAVYPGAIVLSTVVLSEAPFAPLAVLHLGCWALAWKTIRTSAMLTYGICGGLLAAAATLMRPSWLLFVPFALVVGSLDHRQPNPILHAAGGVEELQLGGDRRMGIVDAPEPHQRCIPNQLGDATVDAPHHTPRFLRLSIKLLLL